MRKGLRRLCITFCFFPIAIYSQSDFNLSLLPNLSFVSDSSSFTYGVGVGIQALANINISDSFKLRGVAQFEGAGYLGSSLGAWGYDITGGFSIQPFRKKDRRFIFDAGYTHRKFGSGINDPVFSFSGLNFFRFGYEYTQLFDGVENNKLWSGYHLEYSKVEGYEYFALIASIDIYSLLDHKSKKGHDD